MDRRGGRRLLWVAAGIAALAAMVALWISTRTGAIPPLGVAGSRAVSFQQTLQPGEEVYAIDPEIIVGLDYETPERKLVADRPTGPADPFDVTITHAGAGPAEHCRATGSLRRLAQALSSVRAAKVYSPAEAQRLWSQYGPGAATLRIRHTIDSDPKEFGVIVTRDATHVLVFRDAENLFVPSVPLESLEPLSSGCAALML